MMHHMCKFGDLKIGGRVFKTCSKKPGAGSNWVGDFRVLGTGRIDLGFSGPVLDTLDFLWH